MGMDVMGKAPENQTGEYFRANVWYWHPLWGYVADEHPYYAAKVKYAHSNDGDGLNAEDSAALADLLDKDIESGKLTAYIFEYEQEMAALPDEECTICEGRGWRDDDMAVKFGFGGPDKPCNGCDGKGQRRPFGTSYYMDAEVMKEFAGFLRFCGGFEIW